MDILQSIFDGFILAKRYMRLLDKGEDHTVAVYKIYGIEIGDEMLKEKQNEIIITYHKN